MWRLNHNYSMLLRKKFIIPKRPKSNLERQKIQRLLTEQGAGDICYIMSINEDIDGKEMDLKTAIDRVFGYCLSSIIYYINGKVAYFQAEQEYGAPPRFILKRT